MKLDRNVAFFSHEASSKVARIAKGPLEMKNLFRPRISPHTILQVPWTEGRMTRWQEQTLSQNYCFLRDNRAQTLLCLKGSTSNILGVSLEILWGAIIVVIEMSATMNSFLCFFCFATLCYCFEAHFLQYSHILVTGWMLVPLYSLWVLSFFPLLLNWSFFSYVQILDIKVLLVWFLSLLSFF